MRSGEYEFRIFANGNIFGQKKFIVEQAGRGEPEGPGEPGSGPFSGKGGF